MNILQINTLDQFGGAAKIAWDLHRSYQARGYRAWFAVGEKRSGDPTVLQIPRISMQNGASTESIWKKQIRLLQPSGPEVKAHKLSLGPYTWERILGKMGQWVGQEDYGFRGMWDLLSVLPVAPDIIHGHNLHGGFFDLRLLPKVSRKMPFLLTLHDEWMMTGHCGYAVGCQKWSTGCGQCPDLTRYPPINRDLSTWNWRRKKRIAESSTFFLATPSQWLLDEAERSLLGQGIIKSRVIRNGVDLSIFHPANKEEIKVALQIPLKTKILSFVANGVQRNVYKDYLTIRESVRMVAERQPDENLLFIALGEAGSEEWFGKTKLVFVDYIQDPADVARYYQASDLYLHAAKADTFPTTILEALACGTPVIATAVGGIPEQVEEGISGYLVPAEDSMGMADRIQQILADNELRQIMGRNASEIARQKYDLHRQVDDYLCFYEEILDYWGHDRLKACAE
jgi:glycosyltransferase involved in cell wall biosynthesis